MNKIFELNWYVSIFWNEKTKTPFVVYVVNIVRSEVEKAILSHKNVSELLKWVDRWDIQIYEWEKKEITIH